MKKSKGFFPLLNIVSRSNLRLSLLYQLILIVLVINLNSNIFAQCTSIPGVEAITNGDFSLGDDGSSTFGNHVIHDGSAYSWPGHYWIGANAQELSLNNPSIYDHTTGNATGKMLMFDGIQAANEVAWQQVNIPIFSNQTYYFSAWITSLYPTERSTLQFQVKGNNDATWTILGPSVEAPNVGVWQQIFETWNSGTNTSADIRLVNENLLLYGGSGNDYAIDDISFMNSCANVNSGPKSQLSDVASLCNYGGSMTLDTQIPHQAGQSYAWFRNGVDLGNNSNTLPAVNQIGTYTVCIDSANCIQKDTIEVIAALDLDLGPDINLCSPAYTNLNTGIVNTTGLTIQWYKNNILLPSETGTSLLVNTPGTYKVVVTSGSGLCDGTDEIIVTMTAPIPVNDTYCFASGETSASVFVNGTGSYKWYTSETGGTAIASGNSYTATGLTGGDVTYWVVDTAVWEKTAGYPIPDFSSWGPSYNTTYANNTILFTANSNFTIDSIAFNLYSATGSEGWTGKNLNITYIDLTTSTTTNLTIPINADYLYYYKESKDFIVTRLAVNLPAIAGHQYSFNATGDGDVKGCIATGSKFPYPKNDTQITFTGYGIGGTDIWPGYYNWKISVGTVCDRVPVTITENCTCTITCNAGIDQTICYGASATLTATGGTSYIWSNGAITPSITVSPTSTTTYTVVARDAMGCEDTDPVTVNVVETNVNLGADLNLCSPSYTTLNSGIVNPTGITIEWYKNNVLLPNEHGTTLFVNTPGTYKVTASASGLCANSDEVVITTTAPEPVNNTYCFALGETSKTVSVIGAGSYDWYTTATGGTPFSNGSSYIATGLTGGDVTYWVVDNSTLSKTVGYSKGATGPGYNTEASKNTILFTANSNFNIDTISFEFYSGTGNLGWANKELQITYIDKTTSTTTTKTIVIGSGTIISSLESGRHIIVKLPINLPAVAGHNYSFMALGLEVGDDVRGCIIPGSNLPYPKNDGQITFTGYGTGGTDIWPGFYDWKISVGTICDRVPVVIEEVCPCTITCNAGADQTICYGDNATLTATGGTSYLWSTGETTPSITVSPTSNTTYSVTATDTNGCTGTDNVTVNVDTNIKGTSTDASQNSFTTGYNYEFSTSGTDVTVTFELLDNKTGVVAYTWTMNPAFQELGMTLVSGKKFTRTFTGQTIGSTFTVACKFAYAEAPGMAVTKYFTYTVGASCSGSIPGTLSILGSNNGTTVCEGTNITLSAPNTLAGTNYTWYKKADSDASFSLMATTTDSTYVVAPTEKTQYYVGYAGETSDTLTITTQNCTSTACAGTSTDASQNTFTTGYNYEFSTSGTDVTVTFELLDNKTGVVAYTWTMNPGFQELGMTLVSGKKFTRTFTGQTLGATFTVACKFAFSEAPGMAVTKYFTYTVGDNCGAAALSLIGSNNGATVCEGTSITLSAPNTLAGTNYTWYKKADSDASFSLMATTTDSTYVVAPTENTQYYVEFDGETSNTLTITTMPCLPTEECFGTVTTDKTDALTPVSYDYSFTTSATTVKSTITFSNVKTGLTGWCTINGVKSAQLYSVGGAFQTINYSANYTLGQTLTIQWEFGWVGEHMTTKTFTYHVGEDCYEVDLTESTNGQTICAGDPVTLTANHSIAGTDYTWYKKESGQAVFSLFETTTTNTLTVIPSISTSYKIEFGGEESNTVYVSAMVCCSETAGKIILYQENFGTLAANCDRTNTTAVPVSGVLTYAASGFVDDGEYAVIANPGCTDLGNNAGVAYFLDGEDHTTGDTNGGMLFVNNGTASATIFSKTIKNPCLNTTLEFGSWFANACRVEANCPLPVNLTFRVYGKSAGAWSEIPNSSIETGDLSYLSNLEWFERKTTFNSDSYDSLKVEITNNGSPGWGNDALIDDITITACSPSVNLYTDATSFKTDTLVCNNDIVTLTPLAGYDLTTYFATPYYLIQYSGDSTNWNNILPVVNSSNPSWNIGTDTLTTDTTYYRVIVGNSSATVLAVAGGTYTGGDCMLYTITNIAKIFRPTFSIGTEDTITVCEGNSVSLAGTTDGTEWQWEDKDGNIIVPKTNNVVAKNYNFIATQDSVFYFRAFDAAGCNKVQKFNVDTIPLPTYTFDYSTNICEGESVTLTLTITGTPPFSFEYTDGVTTETITGYNSTSWTRTVNPTSTTTYAIKNLTDKNCFAK